MVGMTTIFRAVMRNIQKSSDFLDHIIRFLAKRRIAVEPHAALFTPVFLCFTMLFEFVVKL